MAEVIEVGGMRVGQRVGPFEVEKQLGGGAMGSVYRARYCKTGQKVALKIMAPGLGGNDTALARFEREAEVLKQLSHRNIVRFYVAGRFEGAPFYAMEYIEGETLDRVFKRRGRLTWEEVVELGKQICAALQHAHEQGIIHRDLKPSNLMLTANGTLKLTDFGIAKDLDVTQLTAANCTVGTAAYMSPEQCRGERNLTHKSDLYSLGVLLYELLTGQRPFKAETTMDMFLHHVNTVPERPSRIVLDIPVWLDTLVCQLLEKKPEQRPFDAAVVAQALNQVAEKVAAQQSAGMEAARARVVQRPAGDGSARDADTKTARTLLTGLQRGRRKRRSKRLYEKGWFQAAGISVLLLAVVGILYLVFRPPSADKLFAEAQRLMEGNNPEQVTRARNGPIQEYLDSYGDRKDAQAEQIREWADRYDVALREQQLDKRQRLKLTPEGEAETHARRALNNEELGAWDAANEQWREVAKFKYDPDADLRVWGLLAEKRIQELTTAAVLAEELYQQAGSYPIHVDAIKKKVAAHSRQDFRLDADLVQQAVKAIRYELFRDGDWPAARASWQALKERCEKETGQRPWFLLAAKRVRELKEQTPAVSKDEETKARLQRIKDALEEARRLAAGQPPLDPKRAWLLCMDILDLYHDYPDFRDSPEPRLQEMLEQAQRLQEQLTFRNSKSEIRNPKQIPSSNLEIPNPFISDFGFRISDFGFRIYPKGSA